MQPAWTSATLADPHHDPEKARKVEQMFAAIAPSYDLNNRVHSLGRDQAWRRGAVQLAGLKPTDTVLDIACGTGDLAMAFAAAGAARVLGLDFTVPMLAIAQTKKPATFSPHSRTPTHDSRPRSLTYHAADAMRLPVADAGVDIVSIAFGIRNVTDPAAALREFRRVLRPGGRLVVLEFTVPRNPLVRWANHVYCGWVMPRTASWIARDRSGAYRYLPKSVGSFATAARLSGMISEAGFRDARTHALTFGIAACHVAVK